MNQLVRSSVPETKDESIYYGVISSIPSKANEESSKKDKLLQKRKPHSEAVLIKKAKEEVSYTELIRKVRCTFLLII